MDETEAIFEINAKNFTVFDEMIFHISLANVARESADVNPRRRIKPGNTHKTNHRMEKKTKQTQQVVMSHSTAPLYATRNTKNQRHNQRKQEQKTTTTLTCLFLSEEINQS